MTAQVIRDGQPVGPPKEYSSGGTKGRKNQREALKTHTEQKALAEIGPTLQPGDKVVMNGHYDSCKPGCQPAIRDTVRDKQVTVEYNNTETGTTQTTKPVPKDEPLTGKTGRPVKGDVVTETKDSEGNVTDERRYWKKDDGTNASAPVAGED